MTLKRGTIRAAESRRILILCILIPDYNMTLKNINWQGGR